MKILALHGFLGLPEDWARCFEAAGAEADAWADTGKDGLVGQGGFEAIDLWDFLRAHSRAGNGDGADTATGSGTATVSDSFALSDWFESFAVSLNRLARVQSEKPVLLGYSLGGRLAMHALIADPAAYSAAIIVSANPGLSTDDERRARLINDQEWATRFASMPWSELMAAWNGQGVFQGQRAASSGCGFVELTREENRFERDLLCQALDVWSLGRQKDLRSELMALSLPILYVSGANDAKFTELLSSLTGSVTDTGAGRVSRNVVIENAGHRVPWDHPKRFVEVMTEFLERVASGQR